jgi:phosphohistidine phosphatase
VKRLILLRHAKSARPAGVPDRERPLATRGIGDARAMGEYMRAEMLLPDLALVSPALRARQSWGLVRDALGEDLPERLEPAIYDAGDAGELLDLARGAPPAAVTLLMVGHNPPMEDLALALAGHGDRYALARMRAKYPTCGLAVLDVAATDWAAFASGAARLDRFVTPKSLGLGMDD